MFISLPVIVFSIIMLIRNQIVFKAKIKSINVTRKKIMMLLDETDPPWDCESIWSEWRAFGSYDGMMLDLFKWKYEHFYPNWEIEEVNNLENQTIH